MPKIELQTLINSKIDICFDLSRSIDLHKISTARTNEKAIDGKVSGLICLDEFVTWEAIHFGVKQKLTSKITEYSRPNHFRDIQLKGAFKYFVHDHIFKEENEKVLMVDIFEFQSPLGFLGIMVDKFIMTNYLKRFLIERNNLIKEYAETEKWREILKSSA